MLDRLRYLFGQYLDNKCSRKELEEFFSFVRQAEHDEAMRSLIREVYDSLRDHTATVTRVDENGQLIMKEPDWLSKKPVIEPTPTKNRLRLALAVSSLVVIMTVIGFWARSLSSRKQEATVSSLTRKTTDRSESKFILLQDSTKVWLNAASSLEFPDQFNDQKREVYLTGEAYFDVRHADKIPFIIHTGTVSTTVLGTAFNIKAYPGQKSIVVSVSRGKVRISRHDQVITTLVKGQQAKIEDKGTGLVERAVPETSISAWQQGNMIYEEESFEEILRDLERIYNTRIDLQNNSIRELNVSTSFKKEIGVQQALQVLCKLTDTELRRAGGNYVIK